MRKLVSIVCALSMILAICVLPAGVSANSFNIDKNMLETFRMETMEGKIPYMEPVILSGFGELNVYVEANGGNDANDGSESSPVATVTRANEIIRLARQENPAIRKVDVVIGGGQYNLTSTITVEGKEFNNVTYRAKDGETPEFFGGVAFKVGETTKVTDEKILDRLVDQSVRDNLYQYDLGSRLGGVDKIRAIGLPGAYTYAYGLAGQVKEPNSTHELFYKGQAGEEIMTLSRFPNGGHDDPNDDYIRITSVIHEGARPRYWDNDAIGTHNYVKEEDRDITDVFTIEVDHDHMDYWDDVDQAAMFGYWCYDWAPQSIPVTEIDTVERTITPKYPSCYGVVENQKFYIYNLLEEIDLVNEYFIDRKTGILYYYKSPDAQNSDEISVSVFGGSHLLKLKETENVTVKGLSFKTTMAGGIKLEKANNTVVDGCTISNTAGYAGNIEGGTNNVFKNGHVYNVNGGIQVSGGDTATLTKANNAVLNTEFENFSRLSKAYVPAVMLNGVGNIVSHNEMHNAEHNAIMFGGNEHEISYNEIYDVCKESSDAGAIYAGRTWTSRGTVIKYNYIHDMEHTFTEQESLISAIYLDDTFAGTTVYGNVMADISGPGIQFNGGRDLTADSNIIINCDMVVYWQGKPGNFNTHYQHLSESPYDSEIWRERYPVLYEAVTNKTIEDLVNNVFVNNVTYNIRNEEPYFIKTGLEINKKAGMDGIKAGNNFDASSYDIFEDYANGNYQLKNGSKVYTEIKNFPVIDLSTIGIIN